jgi:hypothetical protein
MKTRARPTERPLTEHGHPLIVSSTLIMMAVMGCAVKAIAGMRGQTLLELVRGDT